MALRRGTLLVIVLVIMAGTLAVSADAQQERVVAATVYPAPYGFLHVLSEPIGGVVGVYEYSNYVDWKADTDATSTLAYRTVVERAVTERGRVAIKPVRATYEYTVLAADTPGVEDVLVSAVNGYFYTSPYALYYGDAPREGRDIVIINPAVVDLDRDVTYVLSVQDPTMVIPVVEDGARRDMRLPDLVGVADTCVAEIHAPPNSFPWSGGLLPTPVCTENVKPLVVREYNGQPLYVAFSIATNQSARLVIVFRDATPEVLEAMGFTTRVSSSPYLHVLTQPIDTVNVYFQPLGEPLLKRVEKHVLLDSTAVVDEKRYCVLPVGAEVLLEVTWRPGNETQRELLPGEVIVYRAGGKEYMCRGDLSFLDARPSISMPKIRQFREPLAVNSQTPVLLLLGNGKVYAGTRFMIPYEEHSRNSIVVVTSNPFLLHVTAQSIFETPFFWLSVLLGMLFAGLLLQRPKPSPRTVKVIWDITTPPPMEYPTKQEIVSKVKQYIDSYGVCPDDVDLALRGAILPWRGEKPTDSVIVCNFKTNVATERLLREVVAHMLRGFWAFKRRGRNYGFAYTLVGDSMLVAYVYKQESEAAPEELLLNAIRRATRTYIGIPLHRKHVGLIIVAEPRMARSLRKELVELGVITENHTVRDLAGYISVKFPDLDENERNRILEFAQQIPVILIVGDKMTPVIDYLGEVASGEYEAYLKRRGVKP